MTKCFNNSLHFFDTKNEVQKGKNDYSVYKYLSPKRSIYLFTKKDIIYKYIISKERSNSVKNNTLYLHRRRVKVSNTIYMKNNTAKLRIFVESDNRV